MEKNIRNKYHRALFLSVLSALALSASVAAGCGKKPANQPTTPAESSAADLNDIIANVAEDPEIQAALSKAAANAATDPALAKAVSEAAEDPKVSQAVSEAMSQAVSEAMSQAAIDDASIQAAAEAIAKSQGLTVPSSDGAAEGSNQDQDQKQQESGNQEKSKSQTEIKPESKIPGESESQTQSVAETSPASSEDNSITDAEALASALQHAGIDAGSISGLKVNQDYEKGKQVYEIEFHVGQKEYEYDIDVATGEITKYEVEND